MFLLFRRNIHSSWIIAVTCFGITAGVILVQWLDYRLFAGWSWLLVSLLCLGICFWKRIGCMLVIGFAAGILIGLWRGSQVSGEIAVYDKLIGSTVTVRGSVREDIDSDASGAMLLRLNVMTINGHHVPGTVRVTVDSDAVIRRSDLVTVYGKLSDGFGTFNANMVRPKLVRVDRPVPGDIAVTVRDWFADAIRRIVPEPQASLGIGYLVGQRRSLPAELDDALRTASLTHIVVASGYNLTILVRLARRLLEKKSKYLATLAAACLIVSFMAITGLSPSMSRAGLVAGLSLAAWYYGRKFHPLVLLPIAAAVTLLINPSYGWNDLGWQLSFASFAGVMLIAPLAQAYFFGNKEPGTVRQVLGETVAAQAATLPLVVHTFGTLSNVAIIANLLVLPFVPLAMLFIALGGFGSVAVPFVAPVIALPAIALLSYMIWIIQYVANLPWAQTSLAIGPETVLAYYLILIAASFWMWRSTKYNLRDANIIE